MQVWIWYGPGRFIINEVYGPDTWFTACEGGAERLAPMLLNVCEVGGKRRSFTPKHAHVPFAVVLG